MKPLNLSYTNPFSPKRRFQSHKSSFRWTINRLRAWRLWETLIWVNAGRESRFDTSIDTTWLTWGFRVRATFVNITDVGHLNGRCGQGEEQNAKRAKHSPPAPPPSSSLERYEIAHKYTDSIMRDMAWASILET